MASADGVGPTGCGCSLWEPADDVERVMSRERMEGDGLLPAVDGVVVAKGDH